MFVQDNNPLNSPSGANSNQSSQDGNNSNSVDSNNLPNQVESADDPQKSSDGAISGGAYVDAYQPPPNIGSSQVTQVEDPQHPAQKTSLAVDKKNNLGDSSANFVAGAAKSVSSPKISGTASSPTSNSQSDTGQPPMMPTASVSSDNQNSDEAIQESLQKLEELIAQSKQGIDGKDTAKTDQATTNPQQQTAKPNHQQSTDLTSKNEPTADLKQEVEADTIDNVGANSQDQPLTNNVSTTINNLSKGSMANTNPQTMAQTPNNQANPTETTQPARNQAAAPHPPPASSDGSQPESLADQNIFYMLGVSNGTEDEKNQFLDDLQQTVWEDFVQADMPLLITDDEKVRADEILNDPSKDDMQKQDELLNYLSELIPDLEEIMIEKAMKLKQDLVKERIASMREAFAQDQAKMKQLDDATQLFTQGKWYSGSTLLNQIG